MWNIPFPAQLKYTTIKQQMHRWLSPTVSLSQQVQLQSKSCQSHYRTKPLTAFTKSTIRKITRHLLKMYIVYLFSPHIDTFHIAMITSDGKYVFKKRKTFQKLWKIFDYNDWILSSFSILKKNQVTVAGAGGLVSPRQFIVVSQVSRFDLSTFLDVIFLLSLVWSMSWSMIIRLGGRERRLFWRVGGFNLGALRLLLELLQQRSVYQPATSDAKSNEHVSAIFFASCARCVRF